MPQITEADLGTALDTQLPASLDFLKQMVAINSFTANAAGIQALGDLIAQAFAPLGFEAERIQAAQPVPGQHLILRREGAAKRRIGLVSHLDTVFPPEEEVRNDFAWRTEGERIYGPGTVDIKGGTAMIFQQLSALQEVHPAVFEETSWMILLNAGEEVGAQDFGPLCVERLGPEALACLIYEGGFVEDDTYRSGDFTQREG